MDVPGAPNLGSFGLVQIIVSHDFIVDPIQLDDFRPQVTGALLAVPPVVGSDVPTIPDFELEYNNELSDAALLEF